MNFKKVLKELIVCISLSNLMMMRVWLSILPYNPANSFHLKGSPVYDYLSAMIITVIIALIVWGCLNLSNHYHQLGVIIWQLLYGITLCLSLNGIRAYLRLSLAHIYSFFEGKSLFLLIGVIVIILIFIFLRNIQLTIKQYADLPLMLAPFIFITFGQSVSAVLKIEPELAYYPHSDNKYKASENRYAMPVIWVIFDELDYRLTFGDRPKKLLLPEFDALQKTSIYAINAFSPDTVTSRSIPALLTGKELKSTKGISLDKLMLIGKDGSKFYLKTESTIVNDIRKRGYRTSLYGWVFPYERLFNNYEIARKYSGIPFDRLFIKIGSQLTDLVTVRYFNVSENNHISITTSIQGDAIRALNRRYINFIFLHYPVPHLPNIYNRNTHKYQKSNNPKEGYLDNVALADRLLGEIRITMQKNGVWNKAVVIVSADHHLRTNIYDDIIDIRHVPFLVKLPGQKEGLLVSKHFETVNTKQMILNIVDGKIITPEDLKKWIERL